jgi:outer membrane protein assembly factor BamB
MNGRIYYRKYPSAFGAQTPYKGFVCLDLRTGEELWRKEEGDLICGQDWFMNTPNGQGVIPFLWDTGGSTWDVYDAFTGDQIYSFENASAAGKTQIRFGDDGTLFAYFHNGANTWLARWNSTKALQENGLLYSFTPNVDRPPLQYYPFPGTFDWRLGIDWNVTIPERTGTGRPNNPTAIQYPLLRRISGNVILTWIRGVPRQWIGYDLNTGQELWHTTGQENNNVNPMFAQCVGDGVFATFNFRTMKWTGRSLTTGEILWESDPQEYPWGAYMNYSPLIANGKLFAGSWDGYVHAFDIETGEELWKFYSGDSGRETVFGSWPFWNGPIVADGVVFAGTGEETPTQPLTRGGRIFAIDEETGQEIWSLSGYMALRAIADGYLITYNGYDNLMYCFGKGPSATSVSAPKIAISLGETVVVEGTITDQSAGQLGTPCISDEDMGAWMEYLHMQKPMPSDVEGVEVTIDVIDDNGNYRNIGTATSDISGKYSLVWEPDIYGKYTIIATFEGSESYASSFDMTTMFVQEPSQPDTPIEPEEPEPEAPIISTEIAIIAAVAIVAVIGVVAYWILRKRQ